MSIASVMKRVVAGIGATSLVALGMVAVVPSAHGAEVQGPGQPNAPEKGSLTIHKRLGAEADTHDTGLKLDQPSGEGLNGVTFTYWQVGKKGASSECTPLKTTDNDDWKLISEAQAPVDYDNFDVEGLCLIGVGTSVKTGLKDGEAGFAETGKIDLGFYYVAETAAPSDVISKTAPFFVSVPMPEKGLQGKNDDQKANWLYDIHVYPKNLKLEGPEKTINENGQQKKLVLNETVEWTIEQEVPALKKGEKYESAKIFDYLDSSLKFGKTIKVSLDGETLTESDYKVTTPNNGIVWELNKGKLDTLKAGQTLQVVFTTTVEKVTESGMINNKPWDKESGEPNNGYGSDFNGVTVPGKTTPYTYWGELKVKKVDTAKQALKGAKFAVTEAVDGKCSAEADNPIATGESNEEGIVIWKDSTSDVLGLFVANSSNGELSSPTKKYCLYETGAPAGYTGLTDPQTITIKAGTVASNKNSITEIVNKTKDTPDLPLTGAQGTILLTVLGLTLVSIGAGVVVVSRRRRATAKN
ncbi:SpaH/EbpB family LPXTG-anchored major pilin [Arcanobacterium phocisimile]|uniref:SpaH/EbpB family LPXTG-anchored major pilin n=1 Tax=Arcanobacterium phocisimile TaxID=1302235 RepID=A0ABX7IGL9_9ACTO|nr:SpaH/EbpB family LPXTG-anchored major pilin [Arcanobacterium phocisimile]QRV02268.1 SpaH/EbpB family LPXTG-anchored major pilin [Arcanobacterium phocisimile]